ncbi:hypothetical protein EMPG_12410, partial [Blastomyces silverae]
SLVMLPAPCSPVAVVEPAKFQRGRKEQYPRIGMRVLPGITLVVPGRAGTWGRPSSRQGIPGQVSKLLGATAAPLRAWLAS